MIRNLVRAAVATAVLVPALACTSALPAGDVPADFVGTWYDGVFSPTTFWDEGTYAGHAYEQSMALDIEEDGAYHLYVYNGSSMYGCDLQTWSLFEGAAFVEGDTLRLEPVRGEYQVRSNCYDEYNYNRPATDDEAASSAATYYWAFEDGPVLELWQDGWGDERFTLEPLE